MTDRHCFMSYSNADGLSFARQLTTELRRRYPNIKVWFDKINLVAGEDWDIQIAKAIRSCKCLVFIMTEDSVTDESICRDEWTWALKYKKPIIPLHFHPNAELPFRLNNRQYIDFVSDFRVGVRRLGQRIIDLDSPDGVLAELQHRLADAQRDIRRASYEERPRIQVEIDELRRQIEAQEIIVNDPLAAKIQTQTNIDSGLERERQSKKPLADISFKKFVNPHPGVTPSYFQDRFIETEQVILFLKNDTQRIMTIVGRGGIGKTAMICRLLRGVENDTLPDNFEKKHGKIQVDGIVYLSETGTHKINFANLFADLCKLLPSEVVSKLDAVYKDPKVSIDSKTHQLLESFPRNGQIILLLDNFETVVDADTLNVIDAELDEALRAILHAPQHPIKVILTTRVAPRGLNLYEAVHQRSLVFDAGLSTEYAKEALRLMDEDGTVGLKNAEDELLERAVERTLGYPRALEALFAILSVDRYTTLEELLDMPLPENVVDALVGEAFSRLDNIAQKVMQALAIYNRPVASTAIDYLLQLHLAGVNSDPVLHRLVNMHLARREAGKYYLHPVDREYAINRFSYQADTSFTRKDLTSQAADYFLQARKPRTEWKKLDDLAAQLAEFDLRCEAHDYDAAAKVLLDIDFDYLLLWGHYSLIIKLHEKITGKISDIDLSIDNLNDLGFAYQIIGDTKSSFNCLEKGLLVAQKNNKHGPEGAFLNNLGNSYYVLGELYKAIEYYEQALTIAREIHDRKGEGRRLGNLGNCYGDLGEENKAIENYEQAIAIAREHGDYKAECQRRGNLGHVYLSLGKYQTARINYLQAIKLADEISFLQEQNNSRFGLAQAYLFENDLDSARTPIEEALHYNVPEYNHIVSVLQGIIALRQNDKVSASQAFKRSISQADEILATSPEYYSALDAKGLALCGLVLTTGDSHLKDDCHLKAIETFHLARKIAPHVGIVKSTLRLFDELAKCDTEGILKDMRQAVEGKEPPSRPSP